MEEIWKDVDIFGGVFIGIYQVSNLGKVKSLARLVKMDNGRTRQTKDRILGASKRGVGFSLYKDNLQINTSSINLIWDVFLGLPRKTGKVKIINQKLGLEVGNIFLQNYSEKWLKDKKRRS